MLVHDSCSCMLHNAEGACTCAQGTCRVLSNPQEQEGCSAALLAVAHGSLSADHLSIWEYCSARCISCTCISGRADFVYEPSLGSGTPTSEGLKVDAHQCVPPPDKAVSLPGSKTCIWT